MNKKLKVLMIGLNVQDNVFPLSLTYLSSFAKKYHNDVDFIIKEFSFGSRQSIDTNKSLEQRIASYILLKNPDLVSFSAYIWNIELIRSISKIVKNLNSKIKILVGGVEIGESSNYLLKDRSVDYLMLGEGEIGLKELISYLKGEIAIDKVSSISYFNKGKIIKNKKQIVEDLDNLPFPYDWNVAEKPSDEYSTVRIETIRGCNFSCSYCYYSQVKVRRFSIDYLERNIPKLFENYKFKNLTILDANINVDKKRMKKVFDIINECVKKYGRRISLHIELKPELIDKDVIDILANNSFQVSAELGLQSTDPAVLNDCARPYSLDKVSEGLALLNASNIRYKIDLMYGLPSDNFYKFLSSVCFILKNSNQRNVVAHHFMNLNNTPLFENPKDIKRLNKNNSSMVISNGSENVIDFHNSKLFLEMINNESKMCKGENLLTRK
ncbi:hypothetical protein BVX95_00515 [archaeon D22]|nr:hypothetical protein BVX95_00515 [archaeon D22]